MKTKFALAIVVTVLFSLSACASSGGGGSGDGLFLLDAVEQAAERIAGELPAGSRVAIVAFESHSDKLSGFIMEELTAALFDRKIEVADRENLAYLQRELNFQLSGDVSDESAQSVGKFLAADMVITGQMRDLGPLYRLTTNAIRLETAILASIPRLNVRNDRAMQNMIAALDNQTTAVRTARYATVGQTAPQTAGTFLDRGIMHASQHQYAAAIEDFNEALRLNPDMVGAYIMRGRALFASVALGVVTGENFSMVAGMGGYNVTPEQTRVYTLAEEDFSRAIQLDPNNAVAYRERGNIYLRKRRNDSAMADLNQAIQLSPNDADAYYFRATAYGRGRNVDQTIADYTQAIQLNPNHALAYNDRGQAYELEKRDLDRAMADYTQAIRVSPGFSWAHGNLAGLYHDKGDYDRAIAGYNEALRLDPNSVPVYNNRGLSYFEKGEYDRAIADYTESLQRTPHGPNYLNRARAYAYKGDIERALADYEKSNPTTTNARSGLASSLRSFGKRKYDNNDYDRAILAYNASLQLVPNNSDALRYRGISSHYKRDYNRAIADFEALLRLDPNDSNAQRWLDSARQARGR